MGTFCRSHVVLVVLWVSFGAVWVANAGTIAIKNFGKVDDHYYRGAQPEREDYAALAALGVKTVVDLTESEVPSEPRLVSRAGMTLVHIPMSTASAPTAATVRRFLRIVTDPANQPVFVHCDGGHHRTGAMTAAYRITVDHWTAQQAFAEMERYRFGAPREHPALKAFVDHYAASPVGESSRHVQ